MSSAFEAAFRRVLKSVVREVVEEVLRKHQISDCGAESTPPEQENSLVLQAREAAKRMAISERHLFTMTKKGLLPCVHVGRGVRYRVETIERWIRDSEAADTSRLNSRVVADRSKATPESPGGKSRSNQRKSPKPKHAEPSGSTVAAATSTPASILRQSKPGDL